MLLKASVKLLVFFMVVALRPPLLLISKSSSISSSASIHFYISLSSISSSVSLSNSLELVRDLSFYGTPNKPSSPPAPPVLLVTYDPLLAAAFAAYPEVSRTNSLASFTLIFWSTIVVVCLMRYMSASSMWSMLSEELAARIRIPFRMVMTSSVLRLVFRKVFI